ncbi:unnamed protein product [Didymodactylos carnosus]|uniref:NIF system FeS cluster assembly NifU N-terminal domain-containing protein n=1 Tax=Didymodactylos carnosus TaxID=1234261 RepID=A0A8S2CYU4_9BILA|nr:unnamed protein product [Didymodactylos carnosus]CAF3581154.1 unnamed protein product [Didymodactylos carnosus]
MQAKEGKIVGLAHTGVGCAISTGVISVLSELVINQTPSAVLKIIDAHERMLTHQEYDQTRLSGLFAYAGVSKAPDRIRCALVGPKAAAQLIKEQQ